MPVKRKDIFLSKYMVVLSVAFVSIISYLVENTIASFIVERVVKLNFQVVCLTLSVFIAILPFIGIVYFVSSKCRSIVVTLAIGMLMVLSTIIIAQSKFWIFAPWTYPLVIGVGAVGSTAELLKIIVLSLGIFLVIFAADLKIFLHKDYL